MLLLLIGVLIFLAVLMLVLAVTPNAVGPEMARELNILSERQAAPGDPGVPLFGEMELGLRERLIAPALLRAGQLLQRITPAGTLEETRAKLDRAGNPNELTAPQFLGIRTACSALGIVVALIVLRMGLFEGLMNLAVAALVAVLFFLTPDYWLQSKINVRERLIARALPTSLDLMVACAEAGMGLDQALAEVARRRPGPLSDEFLRVLKEIGLGKTRAEAWRDLSRRGGVEDLRNLAAAVYQADQLGSSIGQVLRVQAQTQRKRYSLRVREEAAKLPVKMLFPLVFLIFPSLFVVLLGPAMVSITRSMAFFGN